MRWEITAVQEACETAQGQVAALQQTLESEKASAESCQSRLEQEAAALRQQVEEAQAALQTQAGQVTSLERLDAELASARQSGETQQRLAALEAQLAEHEEETRVAQNRSAQLEKELRQDSGKHDELRAAKEGLEEQVSGLESRAEAA